MQTDTGMPLGANVEPQSAHQAESELQVTASVSDASAIPNLKRKSTGDVDQDAAAEELAFWNNRVLENRRHESFVEHEKDFAKIKKKVSEYNEKIASERSRADQIVRDIDSFTQSLEQEPRLGVPVSNTVITQLPALVNRSQRLLSEIAHSSLTSHEKLTAIGQIVEESNDTALKLEQLRRAQEQLIKRLEISNRDLRAYTVSLVVNLNNSHVALKKLLRLDYSDSDDPESD